jgi:hypothetical protein
MRAVRLIEFEACWALHLPMLALRIVLVKVPMRSW